MSLHPRGLLSKNIAIEDDQDILVAYGTRISGELLRTIGEPTPPGIWFRVVKIEDGVSSIEQKREEVKV